MQYLDTLFQGALQSSLLHHIVRQIESLKFANDWKMQDHLARAKKFKALFTQIVFALFPLVLSSPAEESAFDKFKVRQNHIVTSRTYLYDLYQEVSDNNIWYSN